MEAGQTERGCQRVCGGLHVRQDRDRILLRKWLGVAPTPEGRELLLRCCLVVPRPEPAQDGGPSRVQLWGWGKARPGLALAQADCRGLRCQWGDLWLKSQCGAKPAGSLGPSGEARLHTTDGEAEPSPA